MNLNAYLHMNGNCKEAFAYYAKHLGGTITMSMSYADAPDAPDKSAAAKNRVLHTNLMADGISLMGSDQPPGTPDTKMQGVTLALNVESVAEADRLFAALSKGGVVHQPLMETFFSHRFGMCVDQFGTNWMVNAYKVP
ncbi:MAG: VOC family protein [Parvibaculum sp.]|nr:VOC family protein [Parvibaculum sp.]